MGEKAVECGVQKGTCRPRALFFLSSSPFSHPDSHTPHTLAYRSRCLSTTPTASFLTASTGEDKRVIALSLYPSTPVLCDEGGWANRAPSQLKMSPDTVTFLLFFTHRCLATGFAHSTLDEETCSAVPFSSTTCVHSLLCPFFVRATFGQGSTLSGSLLTVCRPALVVCTASEGLVL